MALKAVKSILEDYIMIDMQAYLDGLSKQWEEERSKTQMTLGKLIEFLERQNPSDKISGFGELDSYRGYYSDLAFGPSDEQITVKELLKTCKNAMGNVFYGYKGGEFVMGYKTPIWIAHYGCTGQKLISINKDDSGSYSLVLEDDEY